MNKKLHTLLVAIVALALLLCSCSDTPPVDTPDPIATDPKIVSIIQRIREDSLQRYVQLLEDMGTRFALADNRRDVAMLILRKFENFGYTDVQLDSFTLANHTYNGVPYTTWQYNVVATLPGAVYPDSVSIIGGHHDSILKRGLGDPFGVAPGANDNASGVATTLEVARVLGEVGFRPKTTVKFVTFAAEELGLFGSYHYAGKAFEANEKIRMMLNNDMVAYWSNPDTSGWCVNIIDYTNSTSLRRRAQGICSLYTSLKSTNDNKYQRNSDSFPFSLRGYRAIFFISNADDENYHTPNDLTFKCNFKFCREVAKVNCALLVDNNFAN